MQTNSFSPSAPHDAAFRSPAVALAESVSRWSRTAIELGWDIDWIEGAIFPREMVYFLARCDVAEVKRIVESGRQDAYSTMILGEYSARTGAKILSLDYEDDPARAQRARSRVERFPNVRCVKGDAFQLFGKLVRDEMTPTALLIDGPKSFPAMAISLAAATLSDVRLIAHHNLLPAAKDRAHFVKLAEGSVFYEQDEQLFGNEWAELARREVVSARARGAFRSLEESSLGVLTIDRTNLHKLTRPSVRFGPLQPLLMSFAWGRGWYKMPLLPYRIWLRLLGLFRFPRRLLGSVTKGGGQ